LGRRGKCYSIEEVKKATTVLLLLAFALPLPAAAAAVQAPPGNSEADQYFETLPSPAGAHSPDPSKNAGDAVEEGKLTPAGAQGLQDEGRVGRAIADVVAQTAPPGAAGKQGTARRGSENLRGPTAGVNFEVPGDGGMGPLFWLVAAVTGVAAIAFVIDRRKRSAAQ
jgi:hypothetical protein